MADTETQLTCTHCGSKLEAESRFCDRCGGKVTLQESHLPSDGEVPVEDEESEIGKAPTLPGVPKPEVFSGSTAPQPPPAQNKALSDCPHFRLEYNMARIFVEGRLTTFNFQLIPQGDAAREIRDLHVRITTGSGEILEKKPGRRIRRGGPVSVDFNYIPTMPGVRIHADIEISYVHQNCPHRYESDIKYNCAALQNQSLAIENLKVDLNLDANYAADQNVRVLENLGKQEGAELGEELARLDLEPVWKERPLFLMEGMSMMCAPLPIDAVNRETLTLITPQGRRLHLLHGPSLCLGRSRASDILFRVFSREGVQDRDASSSLSRLHISFQITSSGMRICDGNGTPGGGSSSGTWLDDRRLGIGGVDLSSEFQGVVRLGDAPPAHPLSLRIRTGPKVQMSSRCPWLFLMRQDGFQFHEGFLILDLSCRLRDLNADWPDVRIERTLDGYRIAETGQTLSPGTPVSLGDQILDIQPYSPMGMDA